MFRKLRSEAVFLDFGLVRPAIDQIHRDCHSPAVTHWDDGSVDSLGP